MLSSTVTSSPFPGFLYTNPSPLYQEGNEGLPWSVHQGPAIDKASPLCVEDSVGTVEVFMSIAMRWFLGDPQWRILPKSGVFKYSLRDVNCMDRGECVLLLSVTVLREKQHSFSGA